MLSTCEGGRSSKEAPGEGIGLAQAFLLAGSQAVVAAVRPVRDSTAREFVAELHRYWKPGTDLVQPFSAGPAGLPPTVPGRRLRELPPPRALISRRCQKRFSWRESLSCRRGQFSPPGRNS